MINHKQLDNGYKYIEIQNDCAEAKIALQGAHLFHYKVKNKAALLWLSEKAYFEEGKAIRGGIPICFPWFGKNKENTSLPQHGFARTVLWKVVLEEEVDECHTHIRLQLKANANTLEQWPYLFDLYLDVTIGNELGIALSVTNTDSKAFEISTALHTYFLVSNINTVRIKGLDESTYYNALDDSNYKQKDDILIQEEVDRVYSDPSDTITLLDGECKVKLQQEGSNSLVVWNPWIEKSEQMTDMYNDGYKSMVCLETSNAREDARIVKAGETHVLKAVISQEIEK
jgi:glucose-6-phosphate 1-epimerase